MKVWMVVGLLALGLLLGNIAKAEDNVLLDMNDVVSTPIDPLTEYSYVEDTSWTTWNKGLFASYVVANGADIHSTNDALDRGCVEGNPLFGEDPSTGLMVGVKLASGLVIYYLTESVLVPTYGTDARNWAYGTMTVLYGGVAAHNYGISCD
jgi:hypothetical protein